LDTELDDLYVATFAGLEVEVEQEAGDAASGARERFDSMTETAFRELGRDRPQASSRRLHCNLAHLRHPQRKR